MNYDISLSKSGLQDNMEFDTAERTMNFLTQLTDILVDCVDDQNRKDSIYSIVDLFFAGLKEKPKN
jgi:hypothetical protein